MPIWPSVSGPLCGVLVLGMAVSSTGWALSRQANTELKLQLSNQEKSYEKALNEATSKAIKEKIETEAKYAEIKRQQDESYGNLIGSYDAAILRYKEALGRKTSGNYLPSTTDPSGSSTDAGESSLIPIPANDLMICAENTAKAVTAKDWVDTLQKK